METVKIEREKHSGISLALVRRATNLELPMGALGAIAELDRRLHEFEREAIREARAHRATWSQIAAALGITRQALYQRVRRLNDRAERRSAL